MPVNAGGRTLTLRVAALTRPTPEVMVLDLVHPGGRVLPPYTAGAHIDVHTPGGFVRTYSLAEAPPPEGAPLRYRIGIKREAASRGGSAALHTRLRAGDLIAVGSPRNHFALHDAPGHTLLLAAGIGLTPLLAMGQTLQRERRPFTLAVFARSRALLPFADELRALGAPVQLHLDDPTEPEKLDIATLVGRHAPGRQLYLCGPAGFMAAVRQAAAAWPDDAVHLEYFAPPESAAGGEADDAFELILVRRGVRLTVAADQSAVAALHDIGIDIPTSCEQGVCGTCVVGWQAGAGSVAPEHRDFCLSATERQRKLALCCSRGSARGPLVLDL